MALRLLCDEHVGKSSFYPQLRNRFTTKHVLDESQLGAGTADDVIWDYGVNVNFNVLTADEDFVTTDANPGNGTHPGVIYYDDDKPFQNLIRALEGLKSTVSSSAISSNDLVLYIPSHWTNAAP